MTTTRKLATVSTDPDYLASRIMRDGDVFVTGQFLAHDAVNGLRTDIEELTGLPITWDRTLQGVIFRTDPTVAP